MYNYNCLIEVHRMNCNNKEIGCYHDEAIHYEGHGKCLVKGCKCKKFEK